ncbi:MAG: RNA polymerase sigma factor [Candidatus Paceibacterota bacterium]|jgi:RNA polymerase sigma-70 factor (ECF subfamily)
MGNLSIEDIVKEYLAPIYRFAYRLVGNENDASDIAQEVMVKVWKNLGKYDPAQELKPWLFKIARNTSIDWLRRRRQIPFSALDSVDEEGGAKSFADNVVDLELLPDEIFAQAEIKEKFKQALEKLPLNERVIVSLHLEEGLTFDEISKIEDRSLNTVKSAYRRSLVKLRANLGVIAPK